MRALRAGSLFCLASLTQAWFGRATTDLMHDLTPATQPAAVLWGRADRTHRPSAPESVMPYLADGQVLASPDAGHFPELERPERLMEALALIERPDHRRLDDPE